MSQDNRYKNNLITLNKWYKYNNKNEKASFEVIINKLNSTFFIKKRTINDITPDCSTSLTIDNLLLLSILDHILNTYLTMQVNDYLKFNILFKKTDASDKELKGELIFGKDSEGYYLAIKSGTISIKFLLIYNTYFSEIVVYNKSTQEGKDFLSKSFVNFYFTNFKNFLLKVIDIYNTVELPIKEKDKSTANEKTSNTVSETKKETIEKEVPFDGNNTNDDLSNITTLDNIKSNNANEQLSEIDNYLSDII